MHAIAGITCENKKYIYNGWSKEIKNLFNNYAINEPCKLQEYNWNINKEQIFGVKQYNCNLIKNIDINQDVAYSTTKSPKILVYVRIDNNKTSSLSKTKKILKDYFNVNNIKDIKNLYNYNN